MTADSSPAITPVLARFVAHTTFDEIPPAVRRRATIGLLDSCGVMLGGSREEAARIAQQYVATARAEPAATVVGTEICTFPALAAFANGIATHALCYDDTHLPTMTHTSAVVLPAALAAAESTAATGRDLLTAYIVGFEVVATVGRIMGIDHYKKGWHATSTIGVFGATTAAASLMDMNEEEIVIALALAASSAAGLRSNLGYMSMFYHAGSAARLGLDAANLAAAGFSASPDALQADMGFYDMYAGSPEDVDTSHLFSLGQPFDLEEPGPSVKPFPCGALSHRAIQAAINLRQTYEFSTNDVVRVECAVSYAHPRVLIHPRPTDILEGKISIQFPVAVALTYGRCGAQDLNRETLQRADIQKLIRKIDMVVHPSLTEEQLGRREPYDTPATVTVWLRDGNVLEEPVERERGHPTDPFTYEELWDKFYDSVAGVKTVTEARELYAVIDDLPNLSDLNELFRRLRASDIVGPQGTRE